MGRRLGESLPGANDAGRLSTKQHATRPWYISRMQRKLAFELILSLIAAGAMAFLLAVLIRYDAGTRTATIGALSAAALLFAAIARGALVNGVDRDPAAGEPGASRSERPRRLPSPRRRPGASRE
jgi:hypothetical protein